tara:strand:- start:428 stop:721 length:294 start_codon:yes stop_codon:yes gene_type:complete
MLTIEEYTTQIKNLINMIYGKERQKINKWKTDNKWVSYDGYTRDVDVFYHIFNYIEHLGGHNNFMEYVRFIDDDDCFNSEVKWKTIKKKNHFFETFS